jgi:AbrB family looped-hinge helix DNA binding protein
MSTLTVTSKGQVTLRKELLRHLGVAPGEAISVEKLPGGRIEVTRVKRPRQISDIFGILPPIDGVAATDEQIDQAIRDGWAGLG